MSKWNSLLSNIYPLNIYLYLCLHTFIKKGLMKYFMMNVMILLRNKMTGLKHSHYCIDVPCR